MVASATVACAIQHLQVGPMCAPTTVKRTQDFEESVTINGQVHMKHTCRINSHGM